MSQRFSAIRNSKIDPIVEFQYTAVLAGGILLITPMHLIAQEDGALVIAPKPPLEDLGLGETIAQKVQDM